jgi:RNA 3'-terminal phosphate cyclase-like protein
MANRIMDAARGLLTRYIPDVYIYTDVYKGSESGKSPGYALTLVAESTNDCLSSAECCFQPRMNSSSQVSSGELQLNSSSTTEETGDTDPVNVADHLENDYNFATPEDLGLYTAKLLLQEIKKGGCIDTVSQWIHLLFMALGPEDVGKVRLGALSPFSVQFLRDLKTFFGISFKIETDPDTKTILMTAVGVGYSNISKKVT